MSTMMSAKIVHCFTSVVYVEEALQNLPAVLQHLSAISWENGASNGRLNGDLTGHLVHAVEIIPHIQTTILPSQKEHLAQLEAAAT